jgi:hypothetical protein
MNINALHRWPRIAAAAALALALSLNAGAHASASSAISRLDVTGMTFSNPCTGELITITAGTLQLAVNTTADGAGGLHIAVRGNAQGVVAAGATSGEMYRLAGDFWSEQTVADAGYPLIFTIIEVHNAVSAGSASNLIVQIVRHVTINATGEITAVADAVRAECRG